MTGLFDQNRIFLKKSIAGIALVALSVSGCSEQEASDSTELNKLEVQVTEPVERDFKQIKESGVLRMITRYSSSTYYLQQGVERGFEYELVKQFAEEHGLTLEVVIVKGDDNPYDMLNSGEGDLIAANYAKTPERRRYVDFSRPYNIVDQVVAYSDGLDNPPESIEDLDGMTISVRRNSSYYHRLRNLRKEGVNVQINLVSDEMDTETLLFNVAKGEYGATVADDNILQASRRYMNNLRQGPRIAENDTIAWAVRKNSDKLKDQLNGFLYKHFRPRGDGQNPKRSALLNILRRRYFGEREQFASYFESEAAMGTGTDGILSPYDSMIQRIADSAGVDWRMVTSVIAQESKFNPNARSWAGAIGLMQILPRFSEVEDRTALYEPETNIREGVRILKEHLNHYSYMDTTNQWSFALAAYNAGQGHVADARRLAIDMNRNPNEWENAADALMKLMQRRYYQNARYGFARGVETVNYVREVWNRYETYETILTLAQRQDNGRLPGVMGLKTINSPMP